MIVCCNLAALSEMTTSARNAGTLLVKLTCTRGLDERLIQRRVHVLLLLCSQVGVAVLNGWICRPTGHCIHSKWARASCDCCGPFGVRLVRSQGVAGIWHHVPHLSD